MNARTATAGMNRQKQNPHGKARPPGGLASGRILPGTLRQKAWLAMQIKGKFSLSDLVRNALPSGGDARDPRNNISRYVRSLCLVGVLSEMKRRLPPTSPTSNGEKRWVLVRDLGRRAPVVRANGQVFDPNSGALLELADAVKGNVTGGGDCRE